MSSFLYQLEAGSPPAIGSCLNCSTDERGGSVVIVVRVNEGPDRSTNKERCYSSVSEIIYRGIGNASREP